LQHLANQPKEPVIVDFLAQDTEHYLVIEVVET